MTKIKAYSVVLVLLFFIISCAAKLPVDSRVNVIGMSWLTINNVSSIVNNSDLMEVQVTGLNSSSRYNKPEYKVKWFNQNGFEINTILSRWTSFSAYEKSEFNFSAIAPNKSASDFKILIRKER